MSQQRTNMNRLSGNEGQELGNPKANWQQNSGVLRQEMKRGLPIRDASVGDNTGSFLNAERNLLQDRGWKLDGNYWNPPN